MGVAEQKVNKMTDRQYCANLDNAWCKNSKGERVYQNGNDANNPNGMKIYHYKGVRVPAYSFKDVPMRYKAGLY